jgi:hypothetical protein
MYADPAAIRIKRVNLSLNAAELRAIEAIAELNNMQPSAYVRELFFAALGKQIHASNSGSIASQNQASA